MECEVLSGAARDGVRAACAEGEGGDGLVSPRWLGSVVESDDAAAPQAGLEYDLSAPAAKDARVDGEDCARRRERRIERAM